MHLTWTEKKKKKVVCIGTKQQEAIKREVVETGKETNKKTCDANRPGNSQAVAAALRLPQCKGFLRDPNQAYRAAIR